MFIKLHVDAQDLSIFKQDLGFISHQKCFT